MVEIYYHPLSPRNPFFQSGGVRVSLDEFLRKDFNWEDRSDESVRNFDAANPLYSKGVVDFMSRAVFNISGHVTSEADVEKIKSLLERIKNGVKRDEFDLRDRMTSPEFVLGSLPYIFVGFNFDRRTEIPHEGVNSLGSVYEICKILCSNKSVNLSTLLCAHKARRSVEKHALIDRLKLEDVQIALNVVGGIVDNSPVESGKYVFYQPGGNARDIQSVFPPLLHKYFVEGRVEEMIAKLEEHLGSMREYLSGFRTHKLSFSAEDLSRIYREAEGQLSENDNGHLLVKEIARRSTEGRVVGLLNQISDRKPVREYPESDQVVRQIKDVAFILNEPEKIFMRALRETAVYYSWGVLTGREGGIGVGFEIDHDKYQILAWNEGWKKATGKTQKTRAIESPIVYARKSRKDRGSKYLKGLSLRESWR